MRAPKDPSSINTKTKLAQESGHHWMPDTAYVVFPRGMLGREFNGLQVCESQQPGSYTSSARWEDHQISNI
jgi:hypothetical protein